MKYYVHEFRYIFQMSQHFNKKTYIYILLFANTLQTEQYYFNQTWKLLRILSVEDVSLFTLN